MKLCSFRYLLKEGFKNIWCNRTMSIASVAVLVSCLLLTGAALLFSMNVGKAMETVEASNSITVYLNDDLATVPAVQLRTEIMKIPNVAEATFVSKDDAMQKYIDLMGGDTQIMEGMTGSENPLPNAYKVSIEDVAQYQETATLLKQIDGVQKVSDYSDMADKLTRMDTLVRIIGITIVIFLAIVSLFIIANTIRVTMFSRRLEISIMKSVGATNGFIRVPFLVEGMIIGLLSGAIASGIIILIYSQVAGAVSGIIASFKALPVGFFAWWLVLGFMLAGALFGMAGGLISISKYLKKEGGDSIVW